jgi:hypothetical protein
MAAGKPSGQEAGSRSEIDGRNVVVVVFGDLAKEDQRQIKEEMCHKLEEVEAAKMRDKLACYQKTRSDVVQKLDTAKASSSKVNSSSLTPEDLVHLVDVSVASKYGADMAQLTRVLAEDVRHILDSFKQDLEDGLPRQIRTVGKEVLGNTQGKRVIDMSGTSMP